MSDSVPSNCPFCEVPPDRVIDSNAHALAVSDAFPVSPGHALILLRRHAPSLFDLTTEEIAALQELLCRLRKHLAVTLQPDGFNIGINLGSVAGAGIAAHLHQHVVPRWGGDTNFMPVVGHTRVLPQLLADTRKLLAEAWPTA